MDPSGHGAEIALYYYGVTNVWNPSGWIALGGAVVLTGATVVTATYIYENKEEIQAGIGTNSSSESIEKAKIKYTSKSKQKLKVKGKQGQPKLKGKTKRGTSRVPKTGKNGDVYEQVDTKGKIMSRTKYGPNKKPMYRDDYNHYHYSKELGKNLKPHRHIYKYNSDGLPTGNKVVPLK